MAIQVIDPNQGLGSQVWLPLPDPSLPLPTQMPTVIPATAPGAGVNPMPAQQTLPTQSGPLVRPTGGILGSILYALTGPPDSKLTAEEQSKKKGKQKNAGDLAAGAAENPGEQFMGIPSGGGGGLEGIGKILKLVMSMGG